MKFQNMGQFFKYLYNRRLYILNFYFFQKKENMILFGKGDIFYQSLCALTIFLLITFLLLL